MTFLSMLYTLIISPIELLFEAIFTIANRIIGNEGISIVFLSLAVNFLVLPLYKRADELQAEERDIQAKMASRVKQIKRVFKGDERFMMLQEYYRINHYKPIYALKSSVSVLLQIPFFIAAYNLLSGMKGLQGMSFGFIADLGKEDATFKIGSFPVNILPILMTLINVVSGIIYTKGHPVKEKVQIYGLAAIFLVLLYHSPAGLVFYWLLNNVFSLVKNVFYKLKDPKKVLSIVAAIAGAAVLIVILMRSDLDRRQKILLATGCVMLAMPLITDTLKHMLKLSPKQKKKSGKDVVIFFAGAVFMALVTGLWIPSAVINASAEEFIDVLAPFNPCKHIINSMLLSFGSWVLWGGVFYFFMSDKVKTVFCKGIWIICGVAVADYVVFGTTLGQLSPTLIYDVDLFFDLKHYLLNVVAVLMIVAAFLFAYSKMPKTTRTILLTGILSVVGIGSYNIVLINRTYSAYKETADRFCEMPNITLNKNGQNVVVLMLDRYISDYVPYIFNEKPELQEQFDGFTYYPNTISYGIYTNVGTPCLFGGYEYTPERMNARSEESLESKQNEALQVMPALFTENGFDVTVCNPSYAGYRWIPDLSIYDAYPNIKCYNTYEFFNYFEGTENEEAISENIRLLRDRNFYCYSLMKISPLIMQMTLYDNGMYNASFSKTDTEITPYTVTTHIDGLSRSTGYDYDFLNAYTVLTRLSDITTITDSSDNTFLMMTNDTPHAPCVLQEPNYEPALYVDNTAFDTDFETRYTIGDKTMLMETEKHITFYHVNMASFLQLGKWFDYLRENGVYDNTRIILVSDHGRGTYQFGESFDGKDLANFLPLLMVKDFDATGYTVCEDFMTNCDTPTLAASGLIDNPVNPFTRNPINSALKNGPQTVFYSDDFGITSNDNVYQPGFWYTVEGNPHNPDNWTYVGEH